MRISSWTRLGASAGWPALALAIVGCGGGEVSQPGPTDKGGLDGGVAETVASDVARNSGGLLDQIGDLLEMASGAAFDDAGRAHGPGYLWASIRSAEYDETLGRWTLTVEREWSDPSAETSSFGERTYRVTFLGPGDEPQRTFDTDGVLARRIQLEITDGTGVHECPGRTHQLEEVSGSLIATDTDTPHITVNGTYRRQGLSTITTPEGTLSVSRWLDVSVTDVVGRRGPDPFLASTITGSLAGTLRADVEDGGGTSRLVDRSIEVHLEDGRATITSGAASFDGDLGAGEITRTGGRLAG